MKPKIYIDGQAGTTGLQIYDRIGARTDLELLRIDPEKRRDNGERARLLNMADIVFLCLPDAGAIEAVSMITNPNVRVIDASTAHRTAPGWTYGYPELSAAQRAEIAQSRRVANPGCHATGFISSVAPLVQLGIIPRDYPLTCYSLTGYSGGGKKMIADYQGDSPAPALSSPGIYGLTLHHKHLPEMQRIAGLSYPPAFLPVVDDYYKGMATTVLLENRLLPGHPDAEAIHKALSDWYLGQHFVTVLPFGQQPGTLYANTLAGSNRLQLVVYGHRDQTAITALFDNLGKGASGAAVQNMNIMLGLDEATGLD